MTNAFHISFVGLKIGKHEFEFDINDSFFETLPYSLIEKGTLKVWLDLEKKESMLLTSFYIDGTVEMVCSRCNEPMQTAVEGDLQLIYKFGHESYDDDENLIVISPDSYEIDITQPIYELITVSLPSRPIHEEGQCDEEMVKLIEKFQSKEKKESDEVDPRWSALKNLN
jgi:uncharacterized metal-binding protein YceD (DUF177 family)